MKGLWKDPLFNAIFNHPSIATVILNSKNQILEANSYFQKLIGYEYNELVGQSIFNFSTSENRKEAEDLLNQVKTSVQKTGKYEKRYLRKDGSIFWARVTVSCVQTNKDCGEMITIGIIEDISQLKLQQAFADFNELQLQIILDNAPFGICCINKNMQITFTNRALQEMLGYTQEELEKLTITYLTHAEETKDVDSKFSEVKSGDHYHVIRRYLKKDKTYLPVRLSVTKFPENDQKLHGIAMIEDISEQLASEELIRNQQVQIINSSKMAALGEMASGIAHEINNPLTVILGKVNHIKKKLQMPFPEINSMLLDVNKIQETTNRISLIVKGLRTFSRNSENDHMESAKVLSIIEGSVSLCQERFKAAKIDLKVNCPSDLLIQARATEISQVLINLLSNSYDALESLSEKWIRIEAKENQEKIIISVVDSGLGITTEIVNKMMQPFYTTKGVGKGTGLGLSISQGIAKAHHGDLIYDSSSKNTKFDLILPKAALAF